MLQSKYLLTGSRGAESSLVLFIGSNSDQEVRFHTHGREAKPERKEFKGDFKVETPVQQTPARQPENNQPGTFT